MSEKQKILIAEDDMFTRQGLTDIFESEGYEVAAAEDGIQALELFKNNLFDLVCLDIMMPGKNGYDVCREIRSGGSLVPVLFLSAKSEEIDRVLGLELGADDFVSKPFGVKELIARVRAILRRCRPPVTAEKSSDCSEFDMGGYTVYCDEMRAVRGHISVDMTQRDINILRLLHDNRGKVLSRDQIYNAGWGLTHLPNSRSLDQHISQLRKKIENDPANPEIICTVHKAGYRYP